MKVNAIVACDLNYGIGKSNDLPWPKNKDDMKWFRDLTLGHIVIMGRTTWQSLGSKPLANRTNVVVTTKQFEGPDYITSGNMEYIIDRAKKKYPGRYIWIIGGGDIYNQAFPYCDRLYLTIFSKRYECDTFIDTNIVNDFPIVAFEDIKSGLKFEIRERK